MSPKLILEIIALGFLIQGTFFAIFRIDKLIDKEKIKEDPKEALRVQVILFICNLIFWRAIIFFVERFLK
jgi:hypothetical protein